MYPKLSIEEGALFIADSHYPHHGDAFIKILQALDTGEIKTPQLFLMGDNFDLLFGYNKHILKHNQEAITLLQSISTKLEIFYFEGNHDFCLAKLFPNIQVFSRAKQPVVATFGSTKIGLSHGDKFDTSLGYNLYTRVLRHPITLALLKPFEKRIIHNRLTWLQTKEICREFVGFDQKVKRILTAYKNVDLVVEGHFHQGRVIENYISLPSLACQKQVGIAKEGTIVFIESQTLL